MSFSKMTAASLFALTAGLGAAAAETVVNIGHGVQTVFTAPGGRRVQVVGCYHVSQQNTFTGRLTQAMLDEVVARL